MEQSTVKAKALSSPVRLRILRLLKQRPYTLSEAARELKISKTNAKVHLQKLLAAGLVNLGEKHGKWRYYSLKQEHRHGISITIPIVSLLLGVVALWQAMLNRVTVISPDHEYSAITSFTSMGYVFLFIALLAVVAFVVSCTLLLYNKLNYH